MSIITAAALAAAAQGPGVPFTRIWKLLDKIHNKIYALCVVARNQSALICAYISQQFKRYCHAVVAETAIYGTETSLREARPFVFIWQRTT